MITLINPVTVFQFGKSREIITVNVVNININNQINKVLVTVENVSDNKNDFKFSTVLTLWAGVKKNDAPTPDPLDGSYFNEKDTSQAAIENRIKVVIDKLYNK